MTYKQERWAIGIFCLAAALITLLGYNFQKEHTETEPLAIVQTETVDHCKVIEKGDKWIFSLAANGDPFLKETGYPTHITYEVLNVKDGWILSRRVGTKHLRSDEMQYITANKSWYKVGCQ